MHTSTGGRRGSIGRRLVTAVAALAATVAVGVPSPTAVVAAPPIFMETFHPEQGPRGAITILGDSVMLGSAYEMPGFGPSLAQMLAVRGWGPILTKTGVGVQTGYKVGGTGGANMAAYVRQQRAAGWDSPIYIVNLGGNDILACGRSQACAVQDILYLLDEIGPEREVWWSKITMPSNAEAVPWNNALEVVAATHPNLRLWDWPTIQVANKIPIAGDNVHLPHSAAYRMRSALIADDVTTRFGVSQQSNNTQPMPVAVGAPSEFVPLPLERVYDSRTISSTLPAAGVIELDLSTSVPAGSTAVSVNLTAVTPAANGFLSAYPCGGSPPATSNVNYAAGQVRPNHVVVGLGAGSKLCVLSSASSHVLVDLQGAFVTSGGSRLTPLAPTRIADTRKTGRIDPLVLTAPAGAEGVVLNVTGVGAAVPGFIVVYPCDQPIPTTSNLNFVPDGATAGSAYVEVGSAGTVCVHANTPIDMVVDLHGTFSPSGQLRFQAATPQRQLDTRSGLGGWRGQIGLGQQIEVTVAPPGAAAFTGNVTMIQPGLNGFETAFRCDLPIPSTSSVNADTGQIAANSITASSTATLCVRSSVASHLTIDVTGWWLA